jgi:aryl-alcohol dehydrogenase-like predicted oxidoreductase
MKTRRLGSQGPEISVIGFGAWEMGGAHWGPNPPEEDLAAAVRAGLDGGMNWIDTAEVYGKGTSEEILGRVVGAREDVLVLTKVAPTDAGTGFQPAQVREAAEKSLKRLGREVIDVYQLHWPDDGVPIEDTWGAMADLAAEGMVRYIGVSNFNVEQMERCERVRHVDSLQPPFSMLRRDAAKELLPYCARTGVGVISYGPLAYGLLTGTITEETGFEDSDWRSGKSGIGGYERLFKPEVREKHLATVDRLRPIADRLGISLAGLALAWNFHQPGVTGAIAGSRSAKHTTENGRAGDIDLSDKDLADIESALGP